MPTYNFVSIDTPQIILSLDTTISSITLDAQYLITSVNFDVNITPPDEGGGPDPTLLDVVLACDVPVASTEFDFHLASADSLTAQNFNGTRTSVDDINNFVGGIAGQFNPVWTLVIDNISPFTGTLTSWGINIIGSIFLPGPANPIGDPGSPSARTIPSITYKYGQGQRENIKLTFNQIGTLAVSTMDSVRVSPLDGKLEDVILSCRNTGSTTNTTLSLYKVSNSSVIPVIFSRNISFTPGDSYRILKMFGEDASKYINKGDMLYFTVDTVGSSALDLTAQVTINSRNP